MTQFETAVATPAHPHRGVAARPSLAFGWWVVAGATLADLVATGQQQATSVLMGPMLAEMGWTRTDYSIALLLAPMVASIVALIAGGYATRRGGAGLLILGGLITAGALESVAYSSEPWLFWLSRGVGLGAGSGLIGAAVVGGAISRWFDERRSWALTLAALGGALWMAAGTPLAQAGVDLYGWRAGWSALGGASLLLLPAAMLLRGRPLESGRDRDGYRWTGEGARDDFDAGSLDRSEATRTPTFWLLILGCALPLAGVTALSAHLVQHFADIGFTRAEAAMLVGTEGAGVAVGLLGWRALADRSPAVTMLAGSFVLAGAGTLAIVYFSASAPISAVAGFCFALGVGIGGLAPLLELAWEQSFGRGHVTEVRALALPLMLLPSGAGALAAALSFDVTGSYNLAMAAFAVLWFTGALLVLAVRAPQRFEVAAVPLAERLRPHVPPVSQSPSMLAVHSAMPEDVPARVEAAAVELATTDGPPAEASGDLEVGQNDDAMQDGVVALALAPEHEPDVALVGTEERSHADSHREVRAPARSYMTPSSETHADALSRDSTAGTLEDVIGATPADEEDVAPDTAPPLDELVEWTPLWRPPSVAVWAEESVETTDATDAAESTEDVEDVEGVEALLDEWPDGESETNAVVEIAEPVWVEVLDDAELRDGQPSSALRVVEPFLPVRRAPEERPWVPHSTGQAVAAGVVASLVATLVLWFLTRGDDSED